MQGLEYEVTPRLDRLACHVWKGGEGSFSETGDTTQVGVCRMSISVDVFNNPMQPCTAAAGGCLGDDGSGGSGGTGPCCPGLQGCG